MEKPKTAKEILSDAHGVLPQYLNVHCGKITSERNVEAMKAYARQVAKAVLNQACQYSDEGMMGKSIISSTIIDDFIK